MTNADKEIQETESPICYEKVIGMNEIEWDVFAFRKFYYALQRSVK